MLRDGQRTLVASDELVPGDRLVVPHRQEDEFPAGEQLLDQGSATENALLRLAVDAGIDPTELLDGHEPAGTSFVRVLGERGSSRSTPAS